MKILFIDDCPNEKVMPLVKHLQDAHINFTYDIAENVNSAINYIFPNFNAINSEIDLIITDLNIPRYKDGSDCGLLNGLDIIDELIRKNASIPVIVNSATKIPNILKYTALYNSKNCLFFHAESLTGHWLENYINKYMN